MKNIPSVDLADFLSGDSARKQKFIQRSQIFFDLYYKAKQSYEIEGIAGMC